jgi:Ni/Co efflux regulator RcnB
MKRKLLAVLAVAVFAAAHLVHAQDDAPSLGDVARQSRQQKQQNDGQSKPADSQGAATKAAQSTPAKTPAATPTAGQSAQPTKTKRVITNDEIPSRYTAAGYRPGNQRPQNWTPNANPGNDPPPEAGKYPASYWQSQIQAQKGAIASLQSAIESTSSSIQYAGGNCVTNCVQWNEEQKRKQDQVETMKGQLQQQQQRLEEMQEAARQQGYGSSVYDP